MGTLAFNAREGDIATKKGTETVNLRTIRLELQPIGFGVNPEF